MAQERVHGDVPRESAGMRILIDVVVAAVMVAPLVLVGAGGWLLVQRQTGERVQAEVLSCDLDLGHRTASQHCTARWTQDGFERIGPIQGSGDQQVGKRGTATLHDGELYSRSLSLPLVLLGLGLPLCALPYVWVRGLVRRRRLSGGPTPGRR